MDSKENLDNSKDSLCRVKNAFMRMRLKYHEPHYNEIEMYLKIFSESNAILIIYISLDFPLFIFRYNISQFEWRRAYCHAQVPAN